MSASRVTAARIGSAPLTLDWSGLAAASQGEAVPHERLARAWERLSGRFQSGEIGFYDSVAHDELSQAEASAKLARELRASGRYDDILWLGIGGSALGPWSALEALKSRLPKGAPRFHFLQNSDPAEWRDAISAASPARTLVVCVTKSGSTFETLAQFLLALEWLGKERWSTHIVAITDPARGDLLSFARMESIPTLAIAPSIGGRYSVFTPVGLFALELAGLSSAEFLKGAALVRDSVSRQPLEKNQIFLLGAELARNAKSRPITVFMPYSSRLKRLADWFVQLWGESLGKDGQGFTPVSALGATDQHSLLQLLRDGPDDKVTGFVTVDGVDDPVTIPRPLLDRQSVQLPAFRILEGHSLQGLLGIEYQATALVLSRRGRPHFTIRLDALDERSLGALCFSLCVLTAFTGAVMELNPFDQPGVEEAKVYIRESLQSLRSSPAGDSSEDRQEASNAVDRLRRHRESD